MVLGRVLSTLGTFAECASGTESAVPLVSAVMELLMAPQVCVCACGWRCVVSPPHTACARICSYLCMRPSYREHTQGVMSTGGVLDKEPDLLRTCRCSCTWPLVFLHNTHAHNTHTNTHRHTKAHARIQAYRHTGTHMHIHTHHSHALKSPFLAGTQPPRGFRALCHALYSRHAHAHGRAHTHAHTHTHTNT